MGLVTTTTELVYALTDATGTVTQVIDTIVFVYPDESPTIAAQIEAILLSDIPVIAPDATVYDVRNMNNRPHPGDKYGKNFHPTGPPVIHPKGKP